MSYYTIQKISESETQRQAIIPSPQSKRLGVLYAQYDPQPKAEEGKLAFETSFTPYKGMKVYL